MPSSSLSRAARPGEADAVRACVVAAFSMYIARIGKPPGPMTLDFDAEIRAGHVWVVPGEAGFEGAMAGALAAALVQYETAEGFYIDTVAVRPGLQGMGVGRALLEFAEREAVRRGHDSIYLCTNSKMTENQVFYPRIGYVETARGTVDGYDRIYYRKPLTRDLR